MFFGHINYKTQIMPIGVPRIIYCWGEELPAQWTDIYNFIFRRRMVFLMQYLDDELCNQICGLLINIHMEDRSKELEKKEMENSGLFKSGKAGQTKREAGGNIKASQNINQAPRASKTKAGGIANPEDLLTAEDDLAIDQNNMLEQYTLQKITMEWLNWNAQFFDYSDPSNGEPYLYYLADILSKDFAKDSGNLMYANNEAQTTDSATETKKNVLYSANNVSVNKKFLKLFKNQVGTKTENSSISSSTYQGQASLSNLTNTATNNSKNSLSTYTPSLYQTPARANGLEIYYGPFRLLANFAANTNLALSEALPEGFTKFTKSLTVSTSTSTGSIGSGNALSAKTTKLQANKATGLNKLLTLTGDYAKQKLLTSVPGPRTGSLGTKGTKQLKSLGARTGENALGQRLLKREYLQDRINPNVKAQTARTASLGQKGLALDLGLDHYASMPFSKLGYGATNQQTGLGTFDSLGAYARKVATKAQAGSSMGVTMSQEEESKKVFVIINSFGGSVGNGITVHDALQFIKAGSLTLGLGVAASAASLVLAGGTIGERYVTEGCHVMIHQPEGGLNGQASDIWIDANEIMKIRLDVAEIYSLSTYRPRHKILRDLDRDFYLTATETIQYGLADEIATNEVMSQIVEMTSKAWYEVDAQQQRLLESVVQRVDRTSGLDTGSQASS